MYTETEIIITLKLISYLPTTTNFAAVCRGSPRYHVLGNTCVHEGISCVYEFPNQLHVPLASTA